MPAAVANPPISVTRLRPSRIPILLALLAALAHARQHDDGVASIHRDPDRGLDAALREKLGLFDASADTSWPAERWNELVSERLRRLETLWREDRLAQGLAAVPGFAPDLPVPALLPDELEPAFANASWEIARAPGAEAQGPAGPKLAEALATWRSAFAGDSRLDCQVFAVRCRPEEAVCGIRLTASGQGAGAGLQHNATWTCTWRASPSGIELVALRRDSFEVARLLERTEALFLDASEAVFGAGSLFREQLAPGLDFWRTRIPASLDLGFLSHHGIALGDVDGDGLEDLYLCQPGGLPNRLLLHLPGGAVRDVSAAAGVDVLDYSSSALLLELDEDGDVDLLVSTGNALLFYANDGEGRFEPRLEIERSLATSLCAADYDQDGDLDVYVCSYLSPYEKQGLPVPYHDANNGEANALLRNDGDWTFVDATSEVGMDENNRRFSFAAAWEDYDNDGDQDLYVANDFGRNNLYRNEAGRFRDLAGELGAEDVSAGMGVAWGDADGDGWMDLYVTNMYSPGGSRLTSQDGYHGDYSPETEEDYRHHAMGNSFLLNGRGGPFVDATRRSRAGVGGWAWGAIFLDFDNDGRLDLFSPNGFVTGERPGDLDSYFWRQVVLQSPERPGDPGRSYAGGWKAVNRLVRQGYSWNGHERNAAYLNLSGSSFADVSVTSGLGLMDDARTASRVDWDGDGDQDLFVTNRSGPRIRFLCNQRARDDRWIALRLRGTSCNRSAIGARAVLEGRSGERWIRTLRCGEGYLAQSSAGLHFGLGAAEIARLRVRWPGGEWEDFGCPRRGCAHLLVQGSGEAVPLPPAAPPPVLAPSRPAIPTPDGAGRTVLHAPLPLPRLALETRDGRAAQILGIGMEGPRGTGHPLLLVVWSSSFDPCLRELEAMGAAAEDLRGAGFQILALSVDRGEERPRALAALDAIAWPFAAGFASEEAISVFEVIQGALHASARSLPVPAAFLVDPGGQLIATYQGRLDPQTLVRDLALFDLSPEDRRDAAVPFPGRWLAPVPGPGGEQVAAGLAARGLEGPAAEYQLARIEVRQFSAASMQYELGVARWRQGRLDEAVGHLRRAIEIDAGHFLATRSLAMVLHQRGEYGPAVGAYKSALALEPGDEQARCNLGFACLALGDIPAAEGELAALQALGSELAETLAERIRLVKGKRGDEGGPP